MEAKTIAKLEQELRSSEQPVLDIISIMYKTLEKGPIAYRDFEKVCGTPGRDYDIGELRYYGIRIKGTRKNSAKVYLEGFESHEKMLAEMEKKEKEERDKKLYQKPRQKGAVDREDMHKMLKERTYNVSTLAEKFDTTSAAINHHLSLLEKAGLVGFVYVANSKWYYAKTSIDAREQAIIVGLANTESTKKTLKTIVENPGKNKATLARILNTSPNSFEHHLAKLTSFGFVEVKREWKSTTSYPTEYTLRLISEGKLNL